MNDFMKVTGEIIDSETGELRNVTTYISTDLRMNQYYIL